MRRSTLTSLLTLALAAAAGCKQAAEGPPKTEAVEQATKAPEPKTEPAATPEEPATKGWTRLDEAKLSDDMKARLADAQEAQKALGASLMGELKAAVGEGEWAKGIAACKKASPMVNAKVSEAHDVKIGRTSFKVRNPENAPSGWQAPVVEAREASMALFEGPEGQLGYMAPIRMVELCTTCHGSPERIPDDVKKMLAKTYPDDEATGFAANDLRGWFWVEVANR